MPEEGTDTSSAKSVTIDPEREIRSAVLMYAGVSLAIYITGVAQEMLNMVRATATSVPPDETLPDGKESPDAHRPLLDGKTLTGSARIYRELAKYLDSRDAYGNGEEVIRTQFIVDVISGTSAGGINGGFLAKALARNQDMEGLKKLWLTEGDLSKLLNDSTS